MHPPAMSVIREDIIVDAPPDRCFDLARSVDLHVDSSVEIAARAVGGRRGGLSAEGDATVWSARFLGLRSSMETRIGDLVRPDRFSDTMTRGLLREFSHVYRFEPLPDGGCRMSDELAVAAPFGPAGRLAERVYLVPRMRYLVRRRLEHIKAVAEGDGWQRYVGTPPPPR